jgi:membrane-associated PAP2 superfamily phosphatase
MNRWSLAAVIAIGGIIALVFAIWPELDLRIASLFYSADLRFAWSRVVWLNHARDISTVLIGLLIAPAVLAILVKLVRPERRMLISGRAAVFLTATLLLAPIVTANLVFKEHWGRPRPNDLRVFGGPTETFRPWWDPRGDCKTNCAFVGGETAAASWTVAPAALAPPQWRPLAYGAAIAFGTLVSIARMAAGGHFFSDTVFAGLFTFVIVWIAYALLYRRRIWTDETIEKWLERAARALRRPFGGGSTHSRTASPLSKDERRA